MAKKGSSITQDYLMRIMDSEQEMVRDYQSIADHADDQQVQQMARQFAEDHAMKSHKIKDYLEQNRQQ